MRTNKFHTKGGKNMSEQKNETIVQMQAKIKPKIEDIVLEYLDGKVKQSLVEFLEFCHANEIKIKWSATNRWKLDYKKNGIGMLYIGKNPCRPGGEGFEKDLWYIAVHMGETFIKENNLTEVIHNNLFQYVKKNTCYKTDALTILGKEFLKGTCKGNGKRFSNPDAEILNCVKKWLTFTINALST